MLNPSAGGESAAHGDAPHVVLRAAGEFEGWEQMERVHRVCLSIPDDRFTDFSTGRNIPFAAADSTLREPCQGFIDPADTTGWLVRTADTIASDQEIRRPRGDSQKPVTQFT